MSSINLNIKKSGVLGIVAWGLLCLSSAVLYPQFIHASSIAGFDPGNIMDDFVMTDSDTMNASQIQSFLNSKVPVCDTNHVGFYGSSGTWYGPPFTCLKDYTENNLTAAQIIYNAAKTYDINPQVLLVLLQKEQALITDTWPASYQYKSATGYGCPDSTPGVCNSSYFGFTNQVNNAAKLFHSVIVSSPTWYSPYVLGNNIIKWSPNDSCGSSNVYIQNLATAALYDYTPYRPNQASLNAGYGTGDSCSSYGNRNFYLYFTDWFGSTRAFVYGGVSYSNVFDIDFYLNRYPDVKASFSSSPGAAFSHFINYGMAEGRQATSDFNVISYKNRYPDLRIAFGNNLRLYYLHFTRYGKSEGRIATGDVFNGTTVFNGVDYSDVYDFDYYTKNNPDIKAAYGLDDSRTLSHFINYGMAEGRQANAGFSVTSYKNRYFDLRRVYGNNARAYAAHYISYGKSEQRIATGDYLGGISSYNGVDYSAVYNFDYYVKNNPDIKALFGLDDSRTLSHFINYGMAEGRQASSDFNVTTYRTRYVDLQAAFGQNLRLYHLHYIYHGKAEARTAI